jgi:CelD/BcsL family acetyltransferase involved in cellulose biosynthesis
MIIELHPESPEWLELSRSRAEALPFHHPSWSMLLAECYGFRAFLLGIRDGNGHALAAGLPALEITAPLRHTRWVSLPFTDFCPPLGDEADVVRLAGALDHIRRERGVASLEVRAPLPAIATAARVGMLHTLRLDGNPDEVARRFRPATARNIRTAKVAGITIRRAQSESDLDEVFYRLQVQTRKRLGLPVQPRRFFRLLWRRILEPGLGFTLFACHRGRPVAGAVFLNWNSTVTYKYGASDAAFWGVRPNDCLFAAAIRWARENDYSTLDFGRTDLGSHGLRRFKRGWGCDEHHLTYSILGADAVQSRRDAGAIVRQILRHSPPWVVRTVGELFYKHAA